MQGCGAATLVELQAGQALYLPAGWFHEVSTALHPDSGAWTPGALLAYGDCPHVHILKHTNVLQCVQVTSFSADEAAGHIAFSYWFHPPDNLRPEGLQRPYTSDFWPALWATRLPQLPASLGSVQQADSDLHLLVDQAAHDRSLQNGVSHQTGTARRRQRRRMGLRAACLLASGRQRHLCRLLKRHRHGRGTQLSHLQP